MSRPAATLKMVPPLPAVGHTPGQHLTPGDAKLFRAFQANLLSLISHELRTPLTGIVNALGILAEESDSEWVGMAKRNAERLQRALVTLLDLAAVESGTFHLRPKEVDFVRLTRTRLDAHALFVSEKKLSVDRHEAPGNPLLADPQKLGRALDLCLQAILPRAEPGTPFGADLSDNALTLRVFLASESVAHWDEAWIQALAGREAGVMAATSAFGGVLQSEEAFLTRTEEGLGGELLLVQEILRLHRGTLQARRDGRRLELRIELPRLDGGAALRTVLLSRAYQVSTELGSLSLVLVRAPGGAGTATAEFAAALKGALFRATDSTYALESDGLVALVLDDCKPEDAPGLLERIGRKLGRSLEFGAAHCPSESADPDTLIELARTRLG